MTHRAVLVVAVLAGSLLSVPAALAHGLLVSVRGEGDTVTGRFYYSNGEPGVGEWVQISDLAAPDWQGPGMTVGADGAFSFPGEPGRSYRVTVSGEEGHSVQSDITLAEGARGQFVEQADDIAADPERGLPPAWALLGGLMALSLIPAAWLRLRARRLQPPPPPSPGQPHSA